MVLGDKPDEAPVADDFVITIYSGRETSFDLPTYDPDGTEVEIFILTEPQGSTSVLTLSNQEFIGTGQRRKVRLLPPFFGSGRQS